MLLVIQLMFFIKIFSPALQCPVIRPDDNVQVLGDAEEANYGNVVRFSCKSNSEMLKGPAEIYCNEEGEWSGTVPKCEGTASLMKTKSWSIWYKSFAFAHGDE